jgi:hypothetical protein
MHGCGHLPVQSCCDGRCARLLWRIGPGKWLVWSDVRPPWLAVGMAFQSGEIERVHAVLRDLASRDVTALSEDEFLDAHAAVAQVVRVAQAWGARFAGETARRSRPELPGGGLSREQGHGNASSMVGNLTGASAAGARSSVEAGDAFTPVDDDGDAGAGAGADAGDGGAGGGPSGGASGGASGPAPGARRVKYPHCAAALSLGEISVDVAGVIVSALNRLAQVMDPAPLGLLEARLVDKAMGRSVADVRRLVKAVIAKVDAKNVQERQRRHHEERYLSWKEDHEGIVTISGRLDAVTAAPIRTVLEQMVTAQYRRRRDQDPQEADHRTVGQMRADALFELARHALGCEQTERSGVRTTVVVRMNLSDLERGDGLGRIDGIEQPISVSELRRLAGDAGLIPEVLGRDGTVLDLGRTVRLFTAAQRTAMLERDGGCAKCHAPPEHCEAHHIRWWDAGGGTDLSNGVMLCTRCHHDIHRQGWGIEVRGGQVFFTPPASIDADQSELLGGVAAFDIDLGELGSFQSGAPPDWVPPAVTEDDIAMVWQWEQDARAAQNLYDAVVS